MNDVGEKAARSGIVSEYTLNPRAKDPVLVCGMPGSGYVGKLGADHMISVFHAKKVAEYRCDSFPPQVTVKEDGTAEPLKAELYFAKTGKARDIFVFTADAQPATSDGEYQLSEEVITFAKGHGVKQVFTLAAYITGSFSKAARVFAAGTSRELLEAMSKNGATLMKEGGVTGMNGLIIGMAAVHGLSGGCLMGETSGYVLDAGASKAVLEVLSKLIDVTIDTASLKEKAEETQKLISQLQTMADQSHEATGTPPRETRPGYIS
ncbi:MAG TPA: proteasome assembly chaperone family protein [Nitrososphaerales archaeon]|nr:proteasome assembly chaperone family protein [Nitrososphaerales archaeon]